MYSNTSNVWYKITTHGYDKKMVYSNWFALVMQTKDFLC